MAALLAVMFIGTSVMSYLYHVHPRENETVISQFARTIFVGPMGWFYYIIQGTTALILVLAANTSFADFPRLASLLARDRFLPRQFATRGDKLVFSNGIIILAIFSGLAGRRIRRRYQPADSALRRRSLSVVHPLAERNGNSLAESRAQAERIAGPGK